MVTFLFILMLCLMAELFYEPRLDWTDAEELLLWYNRKGKRVYTVIYPL